MSLIDKLRGPRIGGLTVFDTGGTIVIAVVVAKKMDWAVVPTVLGAFVLGEMTHLFMSVDTPVTKKLMGTEDNIVVRRN